MVEPEDNGPYDYREDEWFEFDDEYSPYGDDPHWDYMDEEREY